MRTFLRGKVTLLFMMLGLLLAFPAIVLADDLRNNLDTTFEPSFEVLALEAGHSPAQSQDVNIVLQSQGGDGEGGCNIGNATDSEKIEVKATSSNTSAASVKWASTGTDKVTFESCNAANSKNLTVTAGSAGTANVTFTITGATATTTPGVYTVAGTGPGTFDVRNGEFTVNVTPPPNTAPDVSVTGVEHGATYDKGAVPDAGCLVTDAEDGLNDSTTAATLTTDSSALDSDGLGLETVECSYTDGGGITETASATYTIQDPSAPVIGHTLNPATPDGSNGWYKGDVTLTWNVSEPQSPNSLVKTDCVDQNITADQAPTDYSCSATSSGGSAGPVTVSIKRDGTDPEISGADINDTTWRKTDLSANFTASDSPSGLANTADANFTLTTSGQSPNATTPVTASKTVTDNAGNSSTRTISALVDKTAPNVQVTGVSNGANYTTGAVPTPGCNTTDGLSDVKTNATVNVSGGTGGFGTLTATCSGAEDNAGNAQAAPVSVQYTVSGTFNGFLQPIDGHTVNTGKYGRTYPIKWQLRDSNNALISDSAAQALVTNMTGGQKVADCTSFNLEPTDELETSVTGNTALRYDATSDQFIYNYKAPSSGSCYVFAIRGVDGVTTHTEQIDFKFTK